MSAAKPSPYQLAILLGMNRSGQHVYGGTVSAATKTARRATAKAARRARKANR